MTVAGPGLCIRPAPEADVLFMAYAATNCQLTSLMPTGTGVPRGAMKRPKWKVVPSDVRGGSDDPFKEISVDAVLFQLIKPWLNELGLTKKHAMQVRQVAGVFIRGLSYLLRLDNNGFFHCAR
jgi:hypothetical protein